MGQVFIRIWRENDLRKSILLWIIVSIGEKKDGEIFHFYKEKEIFLSRFRLEFGPEMKK